MVSSINHFSPKEPFPYGLVVKSSNPRFLATSPLYSPVPCRGEPFRYTPLFLKVLRTWIFPLLFHREISFSSLSLKFLHHCNFIQTWFTENFLLYYDVWGRRVLRPGDHRDVVQGSLLGSFARVLLRPQLLLAERRHRKEPTSRRFRMPENHLFLARILLTQN